jgi:tetratricopeptide (TPR) repeat protein
MSAERREALSLLTALLFIVHPIQTQAVTYVVQRATGLCAFFYLAALLFYAEARLRQSRPCWFLSWLAALAAMFSKENSHTLFAAVLLYDFCFLGRETPARRRILYAAPYLIFSAAAIFSANFAASQQTNTQQDAFLKLGTEMPRLHYFLTEINVVRTYLRLLFFPWGQNLEHDYPVTRTPADPALLGCLESSVFPIVDVIFEHRLYLPSAGIFLACVALTEAVIRDKRLWRNLWCFLISVLAVIAFVRNTVWRTEMSLWQDAVRKSPNKARPLDNLGASYGELGDYMTAISYSKKAIRADPKYSWAYFNLGVAYKNMKKYQDAIEMFKKAMSLPPKMSHPHFYLADTYAAIEDYDNAIVHYLEGIKLLATPERYNNLGAAYFEKEQYDKAVESYQKALELHPRFSNAHYNLGLVYFQLGQKEKAVESFLQAALYNRKDPEPLISLGNFYLDENNLEEAFRYLNSAVRLDPKSARALYFLGLAYQKQGDRNSALELVEKLREINEEGAQKLQAALGGA